MAGIAVTGDSLIARGENQAFGAGSGDQEAVCGISVRLSWQERALRGCLGVQGEECDTHWSEGVSHPVAEWRGELNSAFCVLHPDFPDRDGRDAEAFGLARLIQLLHACRSQALRGANSLP